MENKFFEKPAIYVDEVSINVMDLERSLAFYCDFMGFNVLEKSERTAVLTADGQTAILRLEQPEGVLPKERRTNGLYHFAILLPTRKDFGAFLKHFVEEKGRELQLGAADHLVSEALYFNDPDGNGIEVARDRRSAEWGWNGEMVDMGTINLDAQEVLQEAEDEIWKGMPEKTRMGHIHLHVANLQETEKFYLEGLGFDIVFRFPSALFTSTNGYHHHIALNIWNGEEAKRPEENSVGLNWFNLVFPDEKSRSTAVERIQEIGGTIREEAEVILTEDPSGNIIRMVIED